MVDLILKISAYIQEKIDCEFTFITKDTENFKEKVKKVGLKAFKIVSGNNAFVHESLRNQDFGFLLREDILLNRVASPIKFLEYTSNGVIPIVTSCVGDYSKQVLDKNLGIVYTGDCEILVNELRQIHRVKNEYRNRLYRFSSKLIWDKFDLEL